MSTPSLTLLADRRAREGAPSGAPLFERRGAEPPRVVVPSAPADPLSGLTEDERRVHDILLGALARANRAASVEDGLTYGEKKHLVQALDLSFLDAEISKMSRRDQATVNAVHMGIATVLVVGPVLFGLAIKDGKSVLPAVVYFVGLMGAFIVALIKAKSPTVASERQQIYEALRELALVVDGGEAPVSEALLRADRLIDTFSSAEETSRSASPRTRVQN